jgi:hypothetical protein
MKAWTMRWAGKLGRPETRSYKISSRTPEGKKPLGRDLDLPPFHLTQPRDIGFTGGGILFKKFFFFKNIYWKIKYIINKITYIRNKFYFHVYFLFFETLLNSSTCSGLFKNPIKSAHVKSKLNYVLSSDLTSFTFMRFLLSVQVLPRIEKILSTYALLMGIERISFQHRTVLYLISHQVCCHITEYNLSSSIHRQQMSLTSKLLK